jgi:hypothetical protein
MINMREIIFENELTLTIHKFDNKHKEVEIWYKDDPEDLKKINKIKKKLKEKL